MDERTISRRRALVLLAAASGAAAARPLHGVTWRALRSDSVPAWTARQDAFLDRFRDSLDAGAVARLGEAYLEANPDEADADRLVNLVTEGWSPDSPLVEAIRDTVQADFEAERTESLASWIVSRTEARLFAVLSLTQ